MESEKIKIITGEQKEELSKQYGFNLNNYNLYFLGFLFNDGPTSAKDPAPFQLETSALEPIAKSGIGLPWIAKNPFDPKLHLRSPDEIDHINTAGLNKEQIKDKIKQIQIQNTEQLIEFQKKYATGEMVAFIHNKQSNNVYAIVGVFPQFEKDVMSGNIPQYLSPMIGNQILNKDNKITGGQLIHIHSVPSPGFPPELAQIKGLCKEGIDKCIVQLKAHAAAGNYTNSVKSEKSLQSLNTNNSNSKNMSLEEQTGNPSSATQGVSEGEKKILETITTIQDEVKTVSEKMETVQSAVVEVATGASGVDETKIKEMFGAMGDNNPAPDPLKQDPKAPIPTQQGAAGNDNSNDYSKLQSDYDALKRSYNSIESDLKDIKDARAQEITDKLNVQREQQALIIVKGFIADGKIKPAEAESKKKELMESKQGETPQDLTLLADHYSSIPEVEQIEIPLAAAGKEPGLGGSKRTSLDDLIKDMN